jgi:DNA (cytosine-5)-methyltransferase 1
MSLQYAILNKNLLLGTTMKKFTSIEICAGGGGQAIGLEMAGFDHIALVEIDGPACATLRRNRPTWKVIECDLTKFDGREFEGIDLLAGGVPCPPFSHGGKQLGADDERNLFPEAIRLVAQCRPRAVMLENVRGLQDKKFDEYRNYIQTEIEALGYVGSWKLLEASDFGVPQLRPRLLFVAIETASAKYFSWPEGDRKQTPTVGDALYDLMIEAGWKKADEWRKQAQKIAPTIVGGSKKHGGPDLGPTRAKRAWAELGVDGGNVAVAPPTHDFNGMPRLTVKMVAKIQGFPSNWEFPEKKTPAYRQVGNAFPPPVAKAVGERIHIALSKGKAHSITK